jgi:hypothetical protein
MKEEQEKNCSKKIEPGRRIITVISKKKNSYGYFEWQ